MRASEQRLQYHGITVFLVARSIDQRHLAFFGAFAQVSEGFLSLVVGIEFLAVALAKLVKTLGIVAEPIVPLGGTRIEALGQFGVGFADVVRLDDVNRSAVRRLLPVA